jgi:hypothetical protein
MSPGWQSSWRQIAFNVEKRTAFAFPVFNIDKLALVMPTLSESSLSDIFRFAIITSKFTIIANVFPPFYIVRSFSAFKRMALSKTAASV